MAVAIDDGAIGDSGGEWMGSRDRRPTVVIRDRRRQPRHS
jgi:hypothetical protein